MKYVNWVFSWVSIILKVMPVVEKIKDLLIVAIAIIKEEANTTGYKKGSVKKAAVVKTLAKKLGIKDASGIVDNTVSVLKNLGVI